MSYNFCAVGTVHSPFAKLSDFPSRCQTKSQEFEGVEGHIVIYPEYVPGLSDLDGFSHIAALFVFHESSPDKKLTVFPPYGDKARGVFATRSPHRPNPIGLSVLRLHSITNDRLQVSGLDMLDGTPILDVKPYIPIDQKTDIRLGWLEEYL